MVASHEFRFDRQINPFSDTEYVTMLHLSVKVMACWRSGIGIFYST